MVKNHYLLLLLTIGIVSTSAGMTLQPARADLPLSNLIQNGDFSLYNASNATVSGNLTYYNFARYGWSSYETDLFPSPPTWANHTPFYNSTYVWVLDSSYCQSRGLDSECAVFGAPAGYTPTLYSNLFTWDNQTGADNSFTFYIANMVYPDTTKGTTISIIFRDWALAGNPVYTKTIDIGHSNYWNSTSPSTYYGARKITFNPSNLTSGTLYYIDFSISNSDTKSNQWLLDNFTFGTSSSVRTIRQSVCTNYYAGNFTDQNATLSCQTPPLDLSDCTFIYEAKGRVSAQVATSSFDSAYLDIALNTSFTQYNYTFAGQWGGILSQVPFYLDNFAGQSDPFLSYYYNHTGAFNTCYWHQTGSNATIQRLSCELSVGCGFYVNNTGCTAVCVNGYLYSGGTFNNETGTCENFASITQCPLGFCGSLTSCGYSTLTYTNFTNSYFDLNTTAYTQGMLSLFNSGVGYAFIVFLMIEIGFYYMTNEFFTLTAFGVMSFICGFMGIFPSWIGYLMALLAVNLIILNSGKMKGGNDAGS